MKLSNLQNAKTVIKNKNNFFYYYIIYNYNIIMPDYKQGKIYTVRCKTDETLIYVGCTTQSLVDKNKYLVYFYNHICGLPIFYTWCINNWYIELFENFPCQNKEQLKRREREVIREIGIINKQIDERKKSNKYKFINF
jgi:hypothetical protein